MSVEIKFIVGRNDVEYSKLLTLQFQIRGMRLMKLISRRIPLFADIREIGLTTDDSNVYIASPVTRDVLTESIMLLTKKFDSLDEETSILVQLVDESDILSHVHLRRNDFPASVPQRQMTDSSTQTSTSSELSSNEDDSTDDLTFSSSINIENFSMIIEPVLAPLACKVPLLMLSRDALFTSAEHVLKVLDNESTLAQYVDESARLQSGLFFNNFVAAIFQWRDIHREDERFNLRQRESHACNVSPCFINWIIEMVALGYGNDSLYIISIGYLFRLVNDYFFENGKLNFSSFNDVFGILATKPNTKELFNNFIDQAPLSRQNNCDFYRWIRSNLFNVDHDEESSTQFSELQMQNIDQVFDRVINRRRTLPTLGEMYPSRSYSIRMDRSFQSYRIPPHQRIHLL